MKPLIGRALQLLGLIILPAGLLIGLAGGQVRLEVKLMFIGGAIFLLGWLLAKKD